MVAPATRLGCTEARAACRRAADGTPAHNLQTLPDDPGTITRNTVESCPEKTMSFQMTKPPTLLQARAFDWLGR
ncbi:MAG: hypothetical protein OXC91_05145 [Rhodobacteraceae bacterium]|nr:hypothetical protein [Paracoccaceae bacterium]